MKNEKKKMMLKTVLSSLTVFGVALCTMTTSYAEKDESDLPDEQINYELEDSVTEDDTQDNAESVSAKYEAADEITAKESDVSEHLHDMENDANDETEKEDIEPDAVVIDDTASLDIEESADNDEISVGSLFADNEYFNYIFTSDWSSLLIIVDGDRSALDLEIYSNGNIICNPEFENVYDGSQTAIIPLEGLSDTMLHCVLSENEVVLTEHDIYVPEPPYRNPTEELYITVNSTDGTARDFMSQTVNGISYIFLPSGSENAKLIFHTSGNGCYVKNMLSDDKPSYYEDGQYFMLGDFTDNHGEALFLNIAGDDGKEGILAVMTSRNLASVYVESEDPVNAGRNYIENSPDHSLSAAGNLIIYNNGFEQEYSGAIDQIRGRGNSTWATAKKPYQVKLSKKADLLDPVSGKQKAKKWLLLSNPFDATLLHDHIVYDLAYELGMTVTPQGRQVDLYYDGEYRGTYYLCEKNEIGENRIEINDLEDNIEKANKGVDFDTLPEAEISNKNNHLVHYVTGITDPENITGGYLLEIDAVYHQLEKTYFETYGGYYFVSKEPEYLSETSAVYISEFVDEVFDCFRNGGVHPKTKKTLSEYIDIESFAKYYLIQEWCKNNDVFTSSTFFYKPQDEDKLYAGPVWDVDASLGVRETSDDPIGWHQPGWSKFWAQNSEFMNSVKSVYKNEMHTLLTDVLMGNEKHGVLQSFEDYADLIYASASMNDTLWNHELLDDLFHSKEYYWQNITDMIQWAETRTAWMDSELLKEEPLKNGLIQDSDGIWRLYQNGEVRTNFTGLYPYGTSLFHLTNGVLDKSVEGIEYYQKKPYYVVKGQVTYNYTGLGEYKGSLHYFTNSVKDESFNGIAYYKGEPYFVVNGKVTYNYVGLGEYKGSLHYFTKSKKDTTFTGLSYYKNEPYYVLNGIVSYKYNGLGQYKEDWWYVVNSMVDKSYTGNYTWKSRKYNIKNGRVI